MKTLDGELRLHRGLVEKDNFIVDIIVKSGERRRVSRQANDAVPVGKERRLPEVAEGRFSFTCPDTLAIMASHRW